jgi:hypothetical protein
VGCPRLCPFPRKSILRFSAYFCHLLTSAVALKLHPQTLLLPITSKRQQRRSHHNNPHIEAEKVTTQKKKKLDIAKAGARMLYTCVGSEMTVPTSACTRKLQTRMFLWLCLPDHGREAKNPPLETDDKWRAECKSKDDGGCKSAILCMPQCMIQEAQARICKTGCI